jgi:hypothetical protein
MITNFKNMRHASLSILGGLALAAAFVSTFYTTASDSLVSPHLKLGNLKGKIMKSLVKTSYANPYYVSANCHIPIDAAADTFAAESCVNIEHAGQGWYRALLEFIRQWLIIFSLPKCSIVSCNVSMNVAKQSLALGFC